MIFVCVYPNEDRNHTWMNEKPKGRNCTRQRNWFLSFRVSHHRRLCLRGKHPRNIQEKEHCLMEAPGDQISKSSCDTLKSVNCNVWASPVAQMVKNPPAMWETWVRSRGCEDSLEEGMATHSSILVWESSWTEEPGGLQFMGSQRVGHDWATKHTHVLFKIINKFMYLFLAESSLSCRMWDLLLRRERL